MSNRRWILVECGGERSVVNVRAVVNGELAKAGDTVTVTSRGAEKKQATLIMASDDRKYLESQLKTERAKCENKLEEAGTTEVPRDSEETPPETHLYEDVRDFSPSGSSWGPDESRASSDSDEVEVEEEHDENSTKRIKLESTQRQYTNSKKTMTPKLRPEPVVPIHLREKLKKLKQISFTNDNRKSNNNKSRMSDEAGPSQPKKVMKAVTVSAEELKKVNRDLAQFKEMLKSLKNAVNSIRMTLSADHLYETVYATGVDETKEEMKEQIKEREDICLNDSTNDQEQIQVLRPIQAIKPITYGELRQNIKNEQQRRDTVSPIVNNNNIVQNKHMKDMNKKSINGNGSGASGGSVISEQGNGDMVPIGSGKTLVPKSIYCQINWNSYTMATRKLLMAVFPRRTLATHSLTGKASPAFLNKPPKLSLDPKKVFDIVLTVTNKCNVKESLVRSAITTKCADENKMMRIQKEKTRKSTSSTPWKSKADRMKTEAHNQTN